jgi:hypothetical protein
VCHSCKKPITTSGFARIDNEVTTPLPPFPSSSCRHSSSPACAASHPSLSLLCCARQGRARID